ncbi:MAG: antitoxin VapB family protein [Candidatus Nanohaloarchaea archaeon]|jgi:predicted CopG family antitoxin
MATKTVSLRETAYEKLKKLKREKESFSDVVERISEDRKQELQKFSGSFPEIGEVEEELKNERDDFEMRE